MHGTCVDFQAPHASAVGRPTKKHQLLYFVNREPHGKGDCLRFDTDWKAAGRSGGDSARRRNCRLPTADWKAAKQAQRLCVCVRCPFVDKQNNSIDIMLLL